MGAKEYLYYIRNLGLEVQAILEECEQLWKLAEMSSATISADKVSDGNKQSSRLEDYAVRAMTMQHDMRYDIYKLLEEKNRARALINKMEHPRDRTLLKNRYINGYSWEKVAEAMNYSLDHAQGYAHRKALEKFSEIFNVNSK